MVKYQVFVVLWTLSSDIETVATAFGRSVESVMRLAKKLRRDGVKLKHFHRPPRSIYGIKPSVN